MDKRINESDILRKWIKNNESILLYGANKRSLNIIQTIYRNFRDVGAVSLIDKAETGIKTIITGEKEVALEVISFENAIKKFDIPKFIICTYSQNTYIDIVQENLEFNGYIYGLDYIDARKLKNDRSEYLCKYAYEELNIGIRYAPWKIDSEFEMALRKVRFNTLVDKFRCYELWSTLSQTKKCLEGDILEVGVWKGGTGALLSLGKKVFDIDCEVFLADTFSGVVKAGCADLSYEGAEHNDTNVNIVKELLEDTNSDKVSILKGIFPNDFADKFIDRKWRFVHIDVDVYESAKDIFSYVWDNVVSGGFVVFDDYGFMSTNGVTDLGNDIASNLNDGRFIYNINGHGIVIKL